MKRTTQLRTVLVAGALASSLAIASAIAAQPGSGGGNGPGRGRGPEGMLQQFIGEPRPFIGIEIASTEDASGVTVAEIIAESPAEAAGLQVGDLITAFNDTPIAEPQDLVDAVTALEIGAEATLSVQRGEETQELAITLGSTEDYFSLEGMPLGEILRNGGRGFSLGGYMMGPNGYLGVSYLTLDETVAAENEVSLTEGALIQEVMEDTPAAEAGLQAGDIVVAVNGEPVDFERTLRDRLIAYEPEDEVTLSVVRGEETLDIAVTLGEPAMMQGLREFNFGLPGQLDLNLEELLPDDENAIAPALDGSVNT